MRHSSVCFLAIAALLETGATAMAQHAGGYDLAPTHSAFTLGVHAAPFSHDPSLQVFFVLEVGGHSHVVPGVVYEASPRVHYNKRHRKLQRKLAKLERKRARAAFKRHQKARREALKRQEKWEREAFRRARKLEREFERDGRQRYLVSVRYD